MAVCKSVRWPSAKVLGRWPSAKTLGGRLQKRSAVACGHVRQTSAEALVNNRSRSCQYFMKSVYQTEWPHHLAVQLFQEDTNKDTYKRERDLLLKH